MELQGDWSYEELSDTTKMAARQTPVLHKSGKKYTAIADGDGRSSEAVNPQDGSVGPTTCCCGLCIVKRYQAFSSPLLLFIIGSMALSPLAITPHLSENEWKSTTALHSILGIACLALLVCTTFIEPGMQLARRDGVFRCLTDHQCEPLQAYYRETRSTNRSFPRRRSIVTSYHFER
eukprot:gb/GECG01003027.1/.p1 GENE.gb/GECG01003027.1/~~gb/GECG01003027.1/.p1  ORF type:complete len:177 (+),score=10.27 gb/GECG01003027.1/:1-531(+)